MALAEFFFTPGLDFELLKILERALKSGSVLQLTQLKTHWLLPYQTLLKGTLHKYIADPLEALHFFPNKTKFSQSWS